VELQPGHRLESEQAQAALRLLGAFEHSPMAGLADLQRVDVSAPGVVVAMTGQGGQITFGLDNLDRQLRRWREIHDLGMRQGRLIASLDLAVENNVPVHWLTENAAPDALPKSVKPSRNRRKNV
jgi:hypothetical protein